MRQHTAMGDGMQLSLTLFGSYAEGQTDAKAAQLGPKLVSSIKLIGMLQAYRAYLTACKIVALAEMLGSTMTLGSAKGSTPTGSARLVDMTAHQFLNVELFGCNLDTPWASSTKQAGLQDKGCG